MVAAGRSVRVMMSVEEREKRREGGEARGKAIANWIVGHLGQCGMSGCLVPD